MVTLPRITVVIATVDGREAHLERAVRAYTRLAADAYRLDLIVEHNHPTVGWAWQSGAEKMQPGAEWLHLTNDDIEPLEGWHEAAIDAIEAGVLPAPRVLNGYSGQPEFFPSWGIEWPDGTPAGLQAIPFASASLWREHIAPMITCHYWTDNWFTYRAAEAGYPAVVIRRYAFKHYWAEVRRGAGMSYTDRLDHDRPLFLEAIAMAKRGEWITPWPPAGE